MRIYLSLQNAWYGKNLEPVIEELLARGHKIVVGVCEDVEERGWLDRLAASTNSVTVTMAPARADVWAESVEKLRHVIDYFHFLGPSFDAVAYSRLRRRREIPEVARKLIRQHQLRYGFRRRAALWWLRRVDESVPADASIVEHLRRHRPGVLVVCPLLGPDTSQHEYVRAAKRLGIPTLYAVHSWDNLSSKGLVRFRPERLAVWNRVQREEAVNLHQQPGRRIAVTGAYPFDAWFETKPSLGRSDFLKRAGLPEDRPLILYLCSALYFAKAHPESKFVAKWVARLRGDARLKGAAVMIRPHPKRASEFVKHNPFAGDPLTAVWPLCGEMPNSRERHVAFFDSLYHADAIVGLNTSAMIEAAIVGRPVYTFLEPRYEVSQQATLHFGYLSDPQTGILRVAKSWETHLDSLHEALTGPVGASQAARFVETFVRPHGRQRKASLAMAEAIEKTARARVLPLVGLRYRRWTLPWLERMQAHAAATEAELKWKPCQTLEQWQERQEFLAALELASDV